MIQTVRSLVPSRFHRPEILTFAIVFGALVIVELLLLFELVNPLLLRPPTEVFALLVSTLQTAEVQAHILMTAQRVAVTFLLSILIGSALVYAFIQKDTLRRAYLPLLGAMFGTPLPLLYLVFVVIFGRGTTAIVAISVPLGVIPFVINATDAIASVDPVYQDLGQSFNCSSWQMARKVLIPAAAPDIFAGLRLGFSYVITSVAAVEFLLAIDVGLGGFISNAYLRFNTTDMFVGIALIVVLVVIFIFVLRQAEAMIQR